MDASDAATPMQENKVSFYPMLRGICIVHGIGIFTIGPLGPCPPPWAVDRKCSKFKISHTAVIAARVAKQRRQRDSV